MRIALSALRLALPVCLTLSIFAFGSEAQFVGHWEGTMVREGVPLQVSFDFTNAGGRPKGTFTSLTQKVMEFPLDALTINRNSLHFVLGSSIVFDGELNTDLITGTSTDDGAKGSFTLHRAIPKPSPYEAIDISFHNGAVTLAGTLCIPRTTGRHAAVVLLQGSGSETRWGTNRFIADRFAQSGIAALVYDKRGSGASTGDWKASSYDDLANDAIAGIDLLASRSEIDPTRIGLHGHSEGGIIAAIAAARAPSRVAFVVAEDTVAGLVRDQDFYRVSHQITQAGFSNNEIKEALSLYKLMLDVACGTKPYHVLATASQTVREKNWYQWLAIPPEDSYLWSWYRKIGNLDTLVFWKEVRAPVLLVYGESDQLVPVNESIVRIEAALDKANPFYTAVIVPNAQHNLTIQPETNGPFFWWKAAPGVVDLVVAWVQRRTGPPTPQLTKSGNFTF